MNDTEKHTIQVRRYLEGDRQTPQGLWILTKTIRRQLRLDIRGGLASVSCTFCGLRCRVRSDSGDLSDPYLPDKSHLEPLFIVEPPSFDLGDRVELASPGTPDFLYEARNGVVVRHSRRKHNPYQPRVRWYSGWATTLMGKHLRRMTMDERIEKPMPRLFDCDKSLPEQ